MQQSLGAWSRILLSLLSVGILITWGALGCRMSGTSDANDGTHEMRGRALLIGVQSYRSFGAEWGDLDGALNDIDLVGSVLRTHYGFTDQNISALRDPTRLDIERGFQQLVEDTREGDFVYIHYSGHGSRVPDANGDEPRGGFDSTLVPVDAREDGKSEILDDEIALWIDQLRSITSDVVLVVDACHSGTITRGQAGIKTRQAPTMDERSYAWSMELTEKLNLIGQNPRYEDRFIRVSACLDREKANEFRSPNGEIYGLLTWYWCKALSQAEPDESYTALVRRVRAQVRREHLHNQNPQLEGRGDAVAFGGRAAKSSATLAVVGIDDDRIQLEGGLLQGVAPNSRYTASPSGLSTLDIESVSSTQSWATLIEGPVPDTGDLFERRSYFHPMGPFRIGLVKGLAPHDSLQHIESRLRNLSHFEIVKARDANAVLTFENDHLMIKDARGDPYGGGTVQTSRLAFPAFAATETLFRTLQLLHTRRDIMSIVRSHLDGRPDVDIEVLELEASSLENEYLVRNGESFRLVRNLGSIEELGPVTSLPASRPMLFRVQNRSPEPVFVYLLNLKPDGRTEGWPSELGGSDSEARIPPRTSQERVAFAQSPNDVGFKDVYVWFITPVPADLTALSANSEGAGRGNPKSGLESLSRHVGGGTLRGERLPLRVGDLATRMLVIEVTEATP